MVTIFQCLLPETGHKIIRVMPNTPCLVGAGASCYCGNPMTSETDLHIVQSLLSAVGLCQRVPESQIDAMSGLMGSGSAYVSVTRLSVFRPLISRPRNVGFLYNVTWSVRLISRDLSH